MILKSIKLCRFKGDKNEWSIEGKPIDNQYGQYLTLENVNLIVGKNASGKSRTIDAIRLIADLLCGDIKISQLILIGYETATYDLHFDFDGVDYHYILDFKEGKIVQELLNINNIEKLSRNGKEGKLWFEAEKKYIISEIDEDILIASRRDKKQHPFFEALFQWGKELNHYQFGRNEGKNEIINDINSIKNDERRVNLKTGNEIAIAFIQANRKFPNFKDIVISDMQKIYYNIERIEVAPIKYPSLPYHNISIKEYDLDDITDQRDMSQGMFRAFSLLVQLNFSLLTKMPSCILIDDIGEGLDYERSKSLIDLIIDKVKDSKVQVLMTTNDRFVMNKVPLEYWSVIQRMPKKSLFYNYQNSKETFDEYKYSGLSNFDFLATDFYITGFEQEQV